MDQQDFLNESDIEALINLLLRSQQSRTREALCFSIGIDPKRLSFIRDSSDSDFYLLLVRHLNEIGEQEALCKLCCKELFPFFHNGKYAPILSDIASTLHCHHESNQNYPNNKPPNVPSSIPAYRVSVNPFNELAKNKLIAGGVIIIFCLLSGYMYKQMNTLNNNENPIEQPVAKNPTKIKEKTMAAVVLYNDIDFGGDSLASDNDVFDMNATNYNDKTSSIKVNSGRWMFCSDANLSGACFEISEGEYPQIQNYNDRISSFKRIG